jgi:hypothetical protein
MLQIDHIYEFLYQELFKDFEVWHLFNGVVREAPINIHDISLFTRKQFADKKIFFYDQEPLIPALADPYIDLFIKTKGEKILATSEHSQVFDNYVANNNFKPLYYFFHGFAALDWYRGYYALNYSKSVLKQYKNDFISFNRIINNDRSYRIYFTSQLISNSLLDHGLVSFGVTDNIFDTWKDEINNSNTKLSNQAIAHIQQYLPTIPNRLIIDYDNVHGSASANIPRTIDSWMPEDRKPAEIDAFWHVVTETVFYYDKLHLTEKIFKPIVSKQPFMLLAAPGNLAYLRSYGFKTFDGIIDESYDLIQDPDQRTEAVVQQLAWYCRLSNKEKQDIIYALEPIIEHNFRHFYGEFQQIIVKELLDNIKALFQDLNYDDRHINYNQIYHVLTN